MSISSDDDTNSTEVSNSEYDSEHDSDVHMRMEDDVDAPDGVDLDGDVDMERDGDDEEEEDEEEEDEEKEDDDEEEEEEEEDKDEDDAKEPRTIGDGEMVHTVADDVDTIVDYQRIVLPEHGQEMREHTPQPQPAAPGPRPRTQETHPLSGLEHLGLVMPWKPRTAVPTRREAVAAGNTSGVDVVQQLRSESAGGKCLPDVPLPDVALPDVPVPEERPFGLVSDEGSSPRVAEEAMVAAFGLGSGSCLVRFHCSNLFNSGIDYYPRCAVFGSLKVYFIYGFCIGFMLLVLCYS